MSAGLGPLIGKIVFWKRVLDRPAVITALVNGKQIRELENFLDAQLFERTKREVRLTLAGEAFSEEAQLTLFHTERAVQGARAAQRTLDHRILAVTRFAQSL